MYLEGIYDLRNSKMILSVFIFCSLYYDFPGGSDGKELACSVGDPGSIHGGEDPLEKGIFV